MLLCGLVAFGAGVVGPNAPALAEELSISATGMVLRCPCTTVGDLAQESKGVFLGDTPNGRYFIPVVFPVTVKQRICSFSMVYQDINQQDTITARLMRKTYTVGATPFNTPNTIATVKSASGVVSTVRKATTTAISNPAVTVGGSFYYIEADVVTTNLNIIGFHITYGPKC
jgi:hypothetical protein